MTKSTQPTLERFIEAIQIAISYDPEVVSPRAMDLLRRAAPVARAIAVLGSPVAGPGACDILDQFTDHEEASARRAIPEPTDPNDETARTTAREDALYLTGFCVGLLIADVV